MSLSVQNKFLPYSIWNYQQIKHLKRIKNLKRENYKTTILLENITKEITGIMFKNNGREFVISLPKQPILQKRTDVTFTIGT